MRLVLYDNLFGKFMVRQIGEVGVGTIERRPSFGSLVVFSFGIRIGFSQGGHLHTAFSSSCSFGNNHHLAADSLQRRCQVTTPWSGNNAACCQATFSFKVRIPLTRFTWWIKWVECENSLRSKRGSRNEAKGQTDGRTSLSMAFFWWARIFVSILTWYEVAMVDWKNTFRDTFWFSIF